MRASRCPGWIGWCWRAAASSLAALLWLATPDPVAAQTFWVHVSVDTRSVAGEQVSTYRASTTVGSAEGPAVVVPRLCVRGTAHRTEERCETHVATVELVQRAALESGASLRCADAVAEADTPAGSVTATARACP